MVRDQWLISISVQSSLESCGACPGEDLDCASIDGVDEVRCQKGQCVIGKSPFSSPLDQPPSPPLTPSQTHVKLASPSIRYHRHASLGTSSAPTFSYKSKECKAAFRRRRTISYSSISFTGLYFRGQFCFDSFLSPPHVDVSITFVPLRFVDYICRSRIQPTFIISNMLLDVYLSMQSQ